MATQTGEVKAPPQTKAHPSAQLKGLRRHLTSYLFLIPYLLAMILFSIGPGLYALMISFADFSTGIPRYFAAGLNNYITAYTDFRFTEVFRNVGIFLAISVPLGIFLVVLLSTLLHIHRGRLASL